MRPSADLNRSGGSRYSTCTAATPTGPRTLRRSRSSPSAWSIPSRTGGSPMTSTQGATAPQSNWSEYFPDGYLREYYVEVATDERKALRYLVDLLSSEGGFDRMLDFGCGPTVHRAIAASECVRQITMADILPQNLEAIRSWVDKVPGHHDW